MRKIQCHYVALLLNILVIVTILQLDGTLRTVAAGSSSRKETTKSLQELDYRVYPRRSQDEAAVIEWGHSAIISALDASVAEFGPQTSQAALLEVETMPILAQPIHGVQETTTVSSSGQTVLKPLQNAEEIHGNVAIMTNTGGLTGLEMATIAQASGAAALVIVNVDEERPDDIYRLPAIEEVEDDEKESQEENVDAENSTPIESEGQKEEGKTLKKAKPEEIDIPVVMISYNSANVLTTATVTPEMTREEVVNNGMPERIRLYAGDDRPFFEDVEAIDPTIYLIHNLLTAAECNSLVEQAADRVQPIPSSKDGNENSDNEDEEAAKFGATADHLQHLFQGSDVFVDSDRVLLWQGMLQSPQGRAAEERIEQVTGFPAAHYSDFIVDRLRPRSHWKSHYDLPLSTPLSSSLSRRKQRQQLQQQQQEVPTHMLPMATLTIFLSDPPPSDNGGGGSLVFPSVDSGDPVQIRPRKGMAVVHHNLDERHLFDVRSVHALLPFESSNGEDGYELYVARKYIFSTPPSVVRRMLLPVLATLSGGRLPDAVSAFYRMMVERFGPTQGDLYFDRACMACPILLVLGLLQLLWMLLGPTILSSMSSSSPSNTKGNKPSSSSSSGKGSGGNSSGKAKKKKS